MSEAGFCVSKGYSLSDTNQNYVLIRLYPLRGTFTLASTKTV